MHGILTEFEIQISPSVDIYCDNQSTINISSDLVQKQQPNPIEVHMHYNQELVHANTITWHYCPTEEEITYIFTKFFTEKRFVYLRYILGINT